MKNKIPEAMNYTLRTIVQGEIGVAVKKYVTSNCPPAKRTVGR